MMKKIILTSLVAFAAVSPAIADNPGGMTGGGGSSGIEYGGLDGEDDFPADGLMLENKTYFKAATKDNLGKVSGDVNTRAQYNIAPGYYMPATKTVAELCPANSYCNGIAIATVPSASAQGLTGSCPTSYPTSESGAGSIFDCYRSGNGACNIVWSGDVWNDGVSQIEGSTYYSGMNSCSFSCDTGYTEITPSIGSFIGNNKTAWTGYSPSIDYSSGARKAMQDYLLDVLMESDYRNYWAIDDGNGNIFFGTSATGLDLGNALAKDGSYMFPDGDSSKCFCRTAGYVTVAGRVVNITSPFVFAGTLTSAGSDSECATMCVNAVNASNASGNGTVATMLDYVDNTSFCQPTAENLVENCTCTKGTNVEECEVLDNLNMFTCQYRYICKEGYHGATQNNGVREAVFSGAPGQDSNTSPSCVANTFSITWKNVFENNAIIDKTTSASYDGNIVTPVKAYSSASQSFLGWKFVKPAN